MTVMKLAEAVLSAPGDDLELEVPGRLCSCMLMLMHELVCITKWLGKGKVRETIVQACAEAGGNAERWEPHRDAHGHPGGPHV